MLKVSERRACRALGQHRSTQRKLPRGRDDEAALVAELIELARTYGRYGYRKVAALRWSERKVSVPLVSSLQAAWSVGPGWLARCLRPA